jgi:hypothetical protein
MIRDAWPLNFGGSPRTCSPPDSARTIGAEWRRYFIVLLKHLIDKEKTKSRRSYRGFIGEYRHPGTTAGVPKAHFLPAFAVSIFSFWRFALPSPGVP